MATKKKTARRIVLVRSRDSGVWMGVFRGYHGSGEVTLSSARKIWRWRGAHTTSELALHGCVPEYSRVAEPVDTTVYGCCEMIESNEAAFAAVNACGWAP